MSWDDHYREWSEACANRRNAEAYSCLQKARKRVSENTLDDWTWLQSALANPEKKWFVARLFERQPIPRSLLPAMVRAAVENVDASSNRWIIEPCMETFGREEVVNELDKLREGGIATVERYEAAMYWLRRDTSYVRAMPPKRIE
jgi:hypothetical protein